MTTSITLRATKGSALTHAEMDANLTNLQTTADAALAATDTLTADKAEAAALGVSNTDQNMGSFTGSTIPDNVSAKAGMQALETAVEARPTSAALASSSGASLIGTGDGITLEQHLTPIVIAARGGGLSDVANINAAFDQMIDEGRDLVFRAGTYVIDGDVVFTPYDAAQANQRNFRISGFGAVLTGSGSATFLMKIGRGFTPYKTVVEGFTFDPTDNTTLDCGLLIERATHVDVTKNTFIFGGTDANYDGIVLQNATAADANTGCFWTFIFNNTFRVITGAQSRPRSCVHVTGNANATFVFKNEFGSAGSGVRVSPASGQTSLANGLDVNGNHFEGLVDYCVDIQGVAGAAGITGFRFDHNRVEQGEGAVIINMEGATVSASAPPIIGPSNYFTPLASMTLVNNPNNLNVTSWAVAITPEINPDIYTREGFTVRAFESHPFTARAGSVGQGYRLLRDTSGIELGSWTYRVTQGSSLKGASLAQPLFLSAVAGLSGTTTECKTLGGSKVLAAGTGAVTFSTAEDDANYRVQLTGNANETFYVAPGQTTGGFTINSSNGASTATVNWLIYR